ncbi:MAG: hypothetical protein H7Y12_07685 [Sphingobacteriaceae bacterium]|nr:hypothetical protein [Cytophagaceae bacterium]
MNANREPSDEELDGLFRQAADGLRPRFDPEAWRDMSARLDTTPQPRPWWQRWSWLSFATLLLLLGGGSIWWQNTRSEERPQTGEHVTAPSSGATTGQRAVPSGAKADVGKRSANPTAPRRTDSPAATGAAPVTVADAVTENDRVAKTTRLAPTETPAKTATDDDPATTTLVARPNGQPVTRNAARPGLPEANGPANRRLSPGAGVDRTGAMTHSQETTRRPPHSDRNQRNAATELSHPNPQTNGLRRERNPSLVVAVKSGKAGAVRGDSDFEGSQQKITTSENTAFAQTLEVPVRLSFDVARLTLKPWRMDNRRMQLPDVTAPDPAEPRIARSPAPVRRGRFGLRAVLAPDLNSVGTFKPSVFGRSYGLLLEYEVLPRLRVQTGVIRSQKDYGSTPADYKWEAGYWSKYPKPDNIDAKCAILDVPLNVRFDVLRRAQSDVFVNGGVSSYVMLNEDYTYRYANKPSYTHEINVSRGGGHFATTLNLSLGYQRQLGGGLSLQLEPYLKLPLAGVGFGSVRLYSTGLHLSLGFHPLSRRHSPP